MCNNEDTQNKKQNEENKIDSPPEIRYYKKGGKIKGKPKKLTNKK